jgi:hypothetical protein
MIILFLKTIYIPDDSFVEINILSIEKINRYLSFLKKKYDATVRIHIEGWIGCSIGMLNFFLENIERLENMFKSENIFFKFKRNNNNIGKLKILQNVKNHYSDFYSIGKIIYADHDIYPLGDIFKCHELLGMNHNGKKIMMICFRQKPESRHFDGIFSDPFLITTLNNVDKINIYYSNSNERIATGCFITTPDIFKMFNCLCNEGNIYGIEDIAIGRMFNSMNFLNVVVDIYVYHPNEKDPKQLDIKKNKILEIIKNNSK